MMTIYLRICREHYLNGLSTMTVLLDAQRQQQQTLTQRNTAISQNLQAKIFEGHRVWKGSGEAGCIKPTTPLSKSKGVVL